MEFKYHQIYPEKEIHGADYSNGCFHDPFHNSV